MLNLDEQQLAVSLDYDESVLALVKDHTPGDLEQYTGKYIDPEDPYDEKPVVALIVRVQTNSKDENDLLTDRLRPVLRPLGYLPFLIERGYPEHHDQNSYMVVLKAEDKVEIPIKFWIAGAGMNYNITDEDFIANFRDWDSRFGIEICAGYGDTLRLKFATLPDDMEEFVLEVDAFCPTLEELAGSLQEMVNTILREFQQTHKLSFWWD